MGTIQRGLKSGGNRTFTADATAGYTTIKAAEVDADYDTIYAEFNGNIENANVKPTAAIAYAKLNLTGSIINADVAAGAAIAYSKLTLTNSLVNADIAAAAGIVGTKLAAQTIATTNIVRGATIAQISNTAPSFTTFSTATLTTVLTKAVTARGAGSILEGTGGLLLLTSLTTGAQAITVSVKRDGTSVVSGNSSFMTQPTVGIQTFFPLPSWFDTAADASAHTYTIEFTFASAGVTTCSSWFYPHIIREYA